MYIDDKFFVGISTEIVYKLRLKKGIKVDEDNLKEIIDEEKYNKAKNTAFKILSHSMQSEEMIRVKLRRKEYEDHIIDRVVSVLKDYKMIDDIELAGMIVRDRKNIKKYGKKRIKQDLFKKGIDSNIIDKVISSEVKDDEEYKNALFLGKKKLKTIKDSDKRKVYGKLSRHLAYKGFSFEIVNKVVRELMEDIND